MTSRVREINKTKKTHLRLRLRLSTTGHLAAAASFTHHVSGLRGSEIHVGAVPGADCTPELSVVLNSDAASPPPLLLSSPPSPLLLPSPPPPLLPASSSPLSYIPVNLLESLPEQQPERPAQMSEEVFLDDCSYLSLKQKLSQCGAVAGSPAGFCYRTTSCPALLCWVSCLHRLQDQTVRTIS